MQARDPARVVDDDSVPLVKGLVGQPVVVVCPFGTAGGVVQRHERVAVGGMDEGGRRLQRGPCGLNRLHDSVVAACGGEHKHQYRDGAGSQCRDPPRGRVFQSKAKSS